MLGDELIKGAKGLAKYTGNVLTPRQAYRLAEEGKIPVIKVGRSLYFRKSEVDAAFRSDAANG
ncbi:MAG: helix-turn-helix domain-containing protein [Erythrobacter sp.]|nr:helix-turn-helix domain-containing protein [Erythrobacter sp.]